MNTFNKSIAMVMALAVAMSMLTVPLSVSVFAQDGTNSTVQGDNGRITFYGDSNTVTFDEIQVTSDQLYNSISGDLETVNAELESAPYGEYTIEIISASNNMADNDTVPVGETHTFTHSDDLTDIRLAEDMDDASVLSVNERTFDAGDITVQLESSDNSLISNQDITLQGPNGYQEHETVTTDENGYAVFPAYSSGDYIVQYDDSYSSDAFTHSVDGTSVTMDVDNETQTVESLNLSSDDVEFETYNDASTDSEFEEIGTLNGDAEINNGLILDSDSNMMFNSYYIDGDSITVNLSPEFTNSTDEINVDVIEAFEGTTIKSTTMTGSDGLYSQTFSGLEDGGAYYISLSTPSTNSGTVTISEYESGHYVEVTEDDSTGSDGTDDSNDSTDSDESDEPDTDDSTDEDGVYLPGGDVVAENTPFTSPLVIGGIVIGLFGLMSIGFIALLYNRLR